MIVLAILSCLHYAPRTSPLPRGPGQHQALCLVWPWATRPALSTRVSNAAVAATGTAPPLSDPQSRASAEPRLPCLAVLSNANHRRVRGCYINLGIVLLRTRCPACSSQHGHLNRYPTPGLADVHKCEFLLPAWAGSAPLACSTPLGLCTPHPCPAPPLSFPRGWGGRHPVNTKFFVTAHCVVVWVTCTLGRTFCSLSLKWNWTAQPCLPPGRMSCSSAPRGKVASMCRSSRSSGAGPLLRVGCPLDGLDPLPPPLNEKKTKVVVSQRLQCTNSPTGDAAGTGAGQGRGQGQGPPYWWYWWYCNSKRHSASTAAQARPAPGNWGVVRPGPRLAMSLSRQTQGCLCLGKTETTGESQARRQKYFTSE